MSLNYFDIMVLDCLCKINGERSGSAVFHLFKGKRSSQTIQDAGLFQTAKYFGMAAKCSRSDISASLDKLEKHSYLAPMSESDTYKVTASGAAVLRHALSERPCPFIVTALIISRLPACFGKGFRCLCRSYPINSKGVGSISLSQRIIRHFTG